MNLDFIKNSLEASIQTYTTMAETALECSSTDSTKSMRDWEGGRAAAYQQAVETMERKLELIDQIIAIEEKNR